ncbi:MAG: TRAP transporter large permease subunit [Gammaproteobacteria bacterium]|nr:TRAP transporter large permease subunit [Gammaproteobacteria bacterium]NIR83059.1 TRAP transporter large permease subunit [Gammaproteobacteria bacterium]NIR90721.1 TRAP transporter large permease subunit [Gammaproteobacteria bacterium]NIU04212.1 TRAP transporter large permease subunit [Gammaproteobacteria bacterium]NIV51504.1 TRAP transporter large permease subunit [Gammaproteobacteria bacterium]
MDQLILSLFLLVALFVLLGSGIWVALSLLGVGFLGMALFTSAPTGQVMATTVWGASHSWALAALPLFIWMGEILFRSGLSDDMFSGLAPWMGRLPGRLMHVNILGCGIFAAVSGSSAATAATIGKMSVPELTRRGYDPRMTIATLAGSGTLGLLVPPSIILIVYGVATEESIARLFVAGILPGVMLVLLFMGYVAVWALLNPDKTPPPEPRLTLGERLRRSGRLIPVLLLIAGVIGSIYFGIATPTDAAAVGVLLSFALAWFSGTLSRKTFVEGLLGATRTSCMIAFILAGAAFLTVAMGFTGIPRMLAEWIAAMQLSPYMLLFALTLFFIVLGCFLDGISVVVLTTAVILPMIEKAGIDTIWFAIYLVIVVEMSQITPPIGFNLFVLQGLTGENILYIARAAIPFFLLLIAAVVLVTLFPELATYLPAQMARRGAG